MAKVTLPITEVELGGSMQTWHYDNALIRSDVNKKTENGNSITEGILELPIATLGAILGVGGEIEAYLMAVRAPLSILETDVPAGLPRNIYFDHVAKTFRAWFVPGAEAWVNNVTNEVIFYTNPFAGNVSQYLKGSEIAILHGLPSTNALLLEEAQVIIDTDPNWVQIV